MLWPLSRMFVLVSPRIKRSFSVRLKSLTRVRIRSYSGPHFPAFGMNNTRDPQKSSPGSDYQWDVCIQW